MWYDFLKKLPVTVNRQKNIGNYIVDFFIAEERIVIEIDGAQHETAEKIKEDQIRDQELRALGITVLRYRNRDIRYNFAAVCEAILKEMGISIQEVKG